MSGWRAVVADDGVEYYIHEPTGTVSWTKPDDDMLREEIATTAEDEVVYSSDEALIAMAPESATPALITDSLDTLNATVSNLVALVAKDSDEPSTGSLDRCWVTLCDPVHDAWEVRHTESQGLDHGEVYYVNKVSGESSWEKPAGFDVSKPVGTVAFLTFPSDVPRCNFLFLCRLC
jgi:WW domain